MRTANKVGPTASQLETIRELADKLGIPAPTPATEGDARFVIDDLLWRERKNRRKTYGAP